MALVAYELKLNRELAMAQIYQERTAIISDHLIGTMGIEAFQQAAIKRKMKQSVSEAEQSLLDDDLLLSLLFDDNTHYQYTLGLIPEEEWAVVLDATKDGLETSSTMVICWNIGTKLTLDSGLHLPPLSLPKLKTTLQNPKRLILKTECPPRRERVLLMGARLRGFGRGGNVAYAS